MALISELVRALKLDLTLLEVSETHVGKACPQGRTRGALPFPQRGRKNGRPFRRGPKTATWFLELV